MNQQILHPPNLATHTHKKEIQIFYPNPMRMDLFMNFAQQIKDPKATRDRRPSISRFIPLAFASLLGFLSGLCRCGMGETTKGLR